MQLTLNHPHNTSRLQFIITRYLYYKVQPPFTFNFGFSISLAGKTELPQL